MTNSRSRHGDSMNVVIFPRTAVGRKLLRSALSDGSSIHDTDFDELAFERDYDGWLESLFLGSRWPGARDAGDMNDA
jgi:hypothetical protein